VTTRGQIHFAGISLLGFICLFLAGCNGRNTRSVVIYTSQDEVYAEPIFKQFEQQTGIAVRAVYDSEAVKTVGLVQRLLNEASHPQCDVFWNNEEMRTRLLVAKNLFRETNGWALLGYRSRRLVVNTNLLPLAKAPQTFQDATNEFWRGKFALAYPLFGTTSTHFMALRQHWGDAPWQSWCRTLAANKPLVVDGNSVVVKLVGSGEAWFGFTDSDDVASEQREGLPIAAVPLCADGLILHNTAGVIHGAPHPVEAQQLFEYLQSIAVQDQLVHEKALESATPATGNAGTGLKVDWDGLLRDLDAATEESRQIFLR
jgi:iron(III) transport system substrate-binding protein